MSDDTALLILNGNLDFQVGNLKNFVKKKSIKKIIAVDGGANKTKKLDLTPDIIIGDLDSITTANLNFYQKKSVEILKYPIEKDKTDSEIAIDYCFKNGINKIYLAAVLGGRIDQQLANLNLLEYIYDLNIEAKIISENLEIAVIDKKKIFKNKKGYRLSLIPQTKFVSNLVIKGCKYNLTGIDIGRSKSRGISNIIKAEKAEIRIDSGLLFYILEKIEQ